MPTQEKQKLCFVIAPIGKAGSDIRCRSDQVLIHIMTPAATECGYKTIRADNISEPGMITSQVIQHLIEDALVIADLTSHNPNVFYELAIRHAIKMPIVQIIQKGETVPFDVAQSRTIHVDHHDLDSVANCKDELIKQIRSVERNPSDVDTPISTAIDLQSLHQSKNPLEKSSADIIEMLQYIRSKVVELSETYRRPRIDFVKSDAIFTIIERLSNLLELKKNEKPSHLKIKEAQRLVQRLPEILNDMVTWDSKMSADVYKKIMKWGDRDYFKMG